ncbi:DUF202 domain-containing protein [uncultured Pontibacter sp.]|uniref:YidH family protein n=1 Tax=uncultured Pontibacter sp. TaxID=453356 RepID=UPI00262AEF7A|nr:DUF202 domain-containing protein [uncultured Pontibacter sp.]
MPAPEQEEIKRLRKKLKKQEKKNAEIRDRMAMQRTIFANERTLMAYLRTAIAIVGGGFAAVKLSEDLYLQTIGLVLIPIGLILALYSFFRYLRKQKLLNQQRQHYEETSHLHAQLHQKQAPGYRDTD